MERRAEQRDHGSPPRQRQVADRLVEIMAGLAAGDRACLWALATEFGDELRRVVRRELRSLGRHDLVADDDWVDGCVMSLVFALERMAPAWRPDGARPWVWGRRALRAAVVAEVGHPSVDLDALGPRAADPVAEAPAPLRAATLEDLAARDRTVALLVEAIDRVGSARDAAVHKELRIQRAAGDPSPSVTVARATRLRPDNVRQIDCRLRRKLRALAEGDPHYAPLSDLAWLA